MAESTKYKAHPKSSDDLMATSSWLGSYKKEARPRKDIRKKAGNKKKLSEDLNVINPYLCSSVVFINSGTKGQAPKGTELKQKNRKLRSRKESSKKNT